MQLPHWEVRDGVYFVTLRRAGTIPEIAMKKIQTLREQLDKVEGSEIIEIKRKIFLAIEKSLDSSRINCDLIKGSTPSILIDAIENRANRKKWRMIEYVIMPNHIHLFLGDLKCF